MRQLRLLLLVPALLMIVSSQAIRSKKEIKTTTYGMCNCMDAPAREHSFLIALSDDHRFHYVNTMGPQNPVDVNGDWELQNGILRLKNYPESVSIHSKWKLNGDQPCITSRKGMEFSRLCETRVCK